MSISGKTGLSTSARNNGSMIKNLLARLKNQGELSMEVDHKK